MTDCIFCKIARHEAPATVELETEEVIAVKSISPAARVHVLIIPKKHVGTFLDLDKEIENMKAVAQELIEKLGIEDEYKLVFNGGKYQSVPHVHWHLLGGDLVNQKDIINKI